MEVDDDDCDDCDDDSDTQQRRRSSLSSSSSSSSSSDLSSLSLSSSSSSSDGSLMSVDVLLSDDEDEIHAQRMSDFADLLQGISETRVINPHKVDKCSQLYLVLVQFKFNDPKRFRRNLRVNPDTFDVLVARIEQDPLFSNNAYTQQFPVEIQLAIALY